MTVRQTLVDGAKRLEGVRTPFLDALVLLSHAAGYSKEKLIASYPDEIPNGIREDFCRFIDKRLGGTPVSYIREKKEFYGLEFNVGTGVLVPRPETEILVEAVIGLARENPAIQLIHDACAGSGCIGISIKHEMPHLEVSASDMSAEALSYFKHNSLAILGEEIPNRQSDLLLSVSGKFDVITANPPYLTSEEWERMADNGWPEPRIALDGGGDGLKYYTEIIPQSVPRLKNGGFLVLEADPSQFGPIKKMLMQNGFHTTIIYKDLAGRDRAISAQLQTGETWKT